MLVDPETRRVTAVADQAQAANETPTEVGPELFRHQIETSTSPTHDADELERALRDGRRAVGEAAAAAGVRAVAVATPPLGPLQDQFTNTPRYLRFEGEFGQVAREAHVCAMHVHVEVADEAEGVRVLDGIRPWLPFLTALSANSPYWQERDTGFASWRSQVWGRWPAAGPSEPFGDVETYRRVTDSTMAWGGAMDPGMLYLDARLSESYPTVEVRVADVCVEVEDAVLIALLARALVDASATGPAVGWRADLLRVAGWRAARHGIADDLVHPIERVLVSPREVFAALLDHLGEHLGDDRARVESLFTQLLARGNGAVRQRRRFEEVADLAAVVDDLADATEASWR